MLHITNYKQLEGREAVFCGRRYQCTQSSEGRGVYEYLWEDELWNGKVIKGYIVAIWRHPIGVRGNHLLMVKEIELDGSRTIISKGPYKDHIIDTNTLGDMERVIGEIKTFIEFNFV